MRCTPLLFVVALTFHVALARAQTSTTELQALIDRVAGVNDLAAFEQLRHADIVAAPLIEKALAKADPEPDARRLAVLIENMASDSPRVRQLAADELAAMGSAAAPALYKAGKAQRDAGHAAVADALAAVARRVEDRAGRMNLATALAELYQKHFDVLLTERWPRLDKDPRDADAQHFLCHVPFDRLWAAVKDKPAPQRLRLLLLLRRSAKWTDAMATQLHEFSAREVLAAAAATYWPIEIDPLQKDGAYGWTTRAAKVEGNVVHEPLRLSVKMEDDGNVAERGQWAHIDCWARWTYLFRAKQMYVNKDAVVFSERTIHRDEKPFHGGRRDETSGRCDIVRSVPAEANIPTADITQAELLDWSGGRPYEWAKPNIPQALHDRLKFRPNQHAPPTVIAPIAPEPADQVTP
ncbi:MAG: hypothetical protein WD042_19355 [Phycisphaeraceae bacterium]